MAGMGDKMRTLIVLVLLIATASCTSPPPPATAGAPFAPFGWVFAATSPPGRLALSNFAFDSAHVQAVITGSPDCAASEGTVPSDFVLPLNGTRIIEGAPGSDVCWRRAIEAEETASGTAPSPPQWTGWNRVFLSSGRSIDTRL